MANAVTELPPASSADAVQHFKKLLAHETDIWDVHLALKTGEPGFVLLDVRSPAAFQAGHVPGAINMPHGKIIAAMMKRWPMDTLFVVYCTGPHCNGADRGALRLARLGRPVKKMLGGAMGWLDEGFTLVADSESGTMTQASAMT